MAILRIESPSEVSVFDLAHVAGLHVSSGVRGYFLQVRLVSGLSTVEHRWDDKGDRDKAARQAFEQFVNFKER